jgi:ubiquinone/menaquinone biosynthesis C-methylase UbiE
MLKMPVEFGSEDVQSFERRSKTYEESSLFNFIFDWIQRDALNAVPAGIAPASILDIGCGTGRLLRKAARRWPAARLTGVDPAEGMLKVARLLNARAQFHAGLAEALPLPDRVADLVFSTMSFHHWQDQTLGVQQAARVLQPGGIFVLVDICLPLGLERIFRHGRQAGPSVIQGMFRQAGLKLHAQRKVMARFLVISVGRKTG